MEMKTQYVRIRDDYVSLTLKKFIERLRRNDVFIALIRFVSYKYHAPPELKNKR